MPGNVANATPTLVMPWNLCAVFQHSRAYSGMQNDFADGTNQRSLITFTSKKTWRIQPMLSNNANNDGVKAVLELLRNFYDSVNGPQKAFYFYDVFETSRFAYDATGVSTVGRYTVVFRTAWSQTANFPFVTVQLELEETL
jgi:hypothetical protein